MPIKTQFRFERLSVWQSSRRLTTEIYAVTKGLPKDELFGLTSQLRRAVVSITSNIAERPINAPRPSHENASMASGVLPSAFMSARASCSALLKSFSAIASRTKLTIVFGAGADGAVGVTVCAEAGRATIRDKTRAESARVIDAGYTIRPRASGNRDQ